MAEVLSLDLIAKVAGDAGKDMLELAEKIDRAEASASALESRLINIKKAMIAIHAATDLGSAGLETFDKMVDASKEVSQQVALMNALGQSQNEILAARNAVWNTTRTTTTTTLAENLKTYREIDEVLGKGHEKAAAAALPIAARVQSVISEISEKPQEGLAAAMVKAAQSRPGVNTPEALAHAVGLMGTAMAHSGGQVTPADFQAAFKQRVAGGWNNEFTYDYLPKYLARMKAQGGDATSATADLAALSQQVHGGMGKGAKAAWGQSGLMDRSGAVKDTVKFDNHPFAWVNEDLRPAVERLMSSKHVTAEAAIDTMFTNKKAAAAAKDMYLNADEYKGARRENDENTINNIHEHLRQSDPKYIDKEAKAASINAQALAGASVAPEMTAIEKAKTRLLQHVGDFIHAHPTLAKVGVTVLGGGSAALKYGGEAMQIKILLDILGVLRGNKGGAEAVEKGGSWLMKLLGKGKGAAGAVEQVAGAAEGGGEVVKAVEGAAKAEKAGVALRGVFKAFDAASKLGQVGQGIGRALRAAELIPMVLQLLEGGLGLAAAAIASPVTWIVALAALIGVAVWQIAKHWNTGKSLFDNIKAELGMFWDWLAGGILNFIHMIPGFGGKAATAPAAQVAAAPHPAAQVPPMAAAPGLPGKGKGPWEQPQRPALVAPRQDGGERTHSSPVYLDGKKVGQIVTRYLAHEAGRAQSGASGFDPTMGLTPVGMGYGPY